MSRLALTIYDRDGTTSLGTMTGRVARASERERSEATERGVSVTDILTCATTAATLFQRGGWLQDAAGNRWQLVVPLRMTSSFNPNEARWQLAEEGAG